MTLSYMCHQCGYSIPDGASAVCADGYLYHAECYAEGDGADPLIDTLRAELAALKAHLIDEHACDCDGYGADWPAREEA